VIDPQDDLAVMLPVTPVRSIDPQLDLTSPAATPVSRGLPDVSPAADPTGWSAARANRTETRGYHVRVIPVEAVAAAFAQWVVPDLPLYGMDHERGDLAPW